ncbi:MAG: hypothetical protein LAT66_13655 [Alkalimonas sp.]|nr:hypothetical protein [Alkalimonas sp.]
MTEPLKKTVNWEKYTALSSMLVAVCALVISIWQSYSIQQHNKLSLRPYLEQMLNTNLNGSWDIHIYNQGMGPAQVVGGYLKVDGIEKPDFDSFFDALGEDKDCYTTGMIGRFYKVGDQQVVLRTLNESCFKSREKLFEMLSRIEIVLNYQSLYGESYQLVIGGPQYAG